MTKSGRLGSPSVLIQRHFCETIPSSACLCRFVKQDIKTDVGVINLIVTGHFKDRKSVKQVMWPTVKTPQKKSLVICLNFSLFNLCLCHIGTV